MPNPKRKVTLEGQEKIRLSGYNKWLSSAKEKHGNAFDYSKSFESFKTQKSPEVKIACREHNDEFHIAGLDPVFKYRRYV